LSRHDPIHEFEAKTADEHPFFAVLKQLLYPVYKTTICNLECSAIQINDDLDLNSFIVSSFFTGITVNVDLFLYRYLI